MAMKLLATYRVNSEKKLLLLAKDELLEGRKLNPYNPHYMGYLGQVFAIEGDYGRGLRLLKEALRFHQTHHLQRLHYDLHHPCGIFFNRGDPFGLRITEDARDWPALRPRGPSRSDRGYFLPAKRIDRFNRFVVGNRRHLACLTLPQRGRWVLARIVQRTELLLSTLRVRGDSGILLGAGFPCGLCSYSVADDAGWSASGNPGGPAQTHGGFAQ